ncbi:MAG: hypothetical protein U0133_17050 [Gemmatimonadales bacterium]
MFRISAPRALAAAVTAGLVLTACGKKPAPVPPAETPAATPAPPPAPPPLAVASIDLGKTVDTSNKVTAPLTTFGVHDTIYASVNTTGVGSNATLAAKWTFVKAAGGEVPVNESSLTISPTGPIASKFQITKKTPWPKGKYKVEVSLNGTSAGVKEFEVQ